MSVNGSSRKLVVIFLFRITTPKRKAEASSLTSCYSWNIRNRMLTSQLKNLEKMKDVRES